jgi:hypothetical protein
LDRLVSRDAQIIIVGNDKVGQAPIVSQIPFYPAQILSYPEFAPASEYPDRKYDEGDGHQTALPAGSSNEFDDTESPFLGIDDLREVRKTSVLFGDPNDPSPIGIEGCTLMYDSVREEKPILPPARDPLALSSDWEYPEILDEAHALRDQSRLFGGPGLQEFYGTPGYSRWGNRRLWSEAAAALLHAQFLCWHVQLLQRRTGTLLLGIGVNSDAGRTGSTVLNEWNFDIAIPAANSPGTQKPRSLISNPNSTIDDKPLYFRFEFGYYRIR